MDLEKLERVLSEFEGNDLLEQLDQFGGEVEVIEFLMREISEERHSSKHWFNKCQDITAQNERLRDEVRDQDNDIHRHMKTILRRDRLVSAIEKERDELQARLTGWYLVASKTCVMKTLNSRK